MIESVKRQVPDQELGAASAARGAAEERAEHDLFSGKAPLRPIHRIGFLILGITDIGFMATAFTIMLSVASHEGWCVRYLMLGLVLGLSLVFVPPGYRMVRSALIAPSQKDTDDDESNIAHPDSEDESGFNPNHL